MAPRAPKKDKQPPTPSATSSTFPADFPPETPKRSPSMTTIVFEASTTTSSPAVLKPKNEKAKVVKKTGKGKEKVVVPVESEVEMEMPEAQMEMGTEEDVGEASTATSSPAKAPVLNPKNDKSKVTKAGGEKKSKVTKKEAGDTKKDGKKDVKAVKEGKDVKEKVEKVNGEEAEKLILEYLREQNRPYGATDLSANLRGKITKTVADKLLKEMEQNGVIRGKATNGDKKGSQWVFWCIQDTSTPVTPEQLANLDTEIQTLRETTLPSLRARLKTLTQSLQTIRSSPGTSELRELVKKLEEENEGKRDRVTELRGLVESGEVATTEQTARVEEEYKYWSSKLLARKRCFKEVEGMLLEGMGREELWERARIEGV